MRYRELSLGIEKDWFGLRHLHIKLIFSDEQLQLIDRHDLYEKCIIEPRYEEGFYRVRDLVTDPLTQTCSAVSFQYIGKRYDLSASDRANRDLENIRAGLEDFRWRLIRLSRERPQTADVLHGRRRQSA